MNFDTVVLAAVVEELRHDLEGGRIEKVSQPEPLDLIVGIYARGQKRSLLVSAEANTARIHLLTSRARPNPTTPPAFCMLLRKHLEGARIDELLQPLGFCDRVLQFNFTTSQRQRISLWTEIMGKQSNVVLVSDTGMILGAIKRVTSTMSRFREVRPGIAYTTPPRQLGYRRDPMDPNAGNTLPEAVFSSRDEAAKWLTSTFRGVGSQLAQEAIARRAELPLTSETAWFGLNDVLNAVRLKEFHAVTWSEDGHQVRGAYAVPLFSVPAEQQREYGSISRAVELAFENHQTAQSFERERDALVASVRHALKGRERELQSLKEGLANADTADNIRESGELLLANLDAPAPGAPDVTVPDLFRGDGTEVRTIALDSTLTVQENAERYFKRFRKARDSRATLESRLEKSTGIVAVLTAAQTELDAVSSNQEVAAIAERVSDALPQTQAAPNEPAVVSPFEGNKIKTYHSPDGWVILIGENATSNDYLTSKVASPNDIWFHARAVPSAHGVIRSQNRPASVSSAAIRLAAEQVARRSDAKHARLVAVDYTLKRYVRKPRSSKPGQVTYTNEKTMDVALMDQ